MGESLKNHLFYQNRSGARSCFTIRKTRFYRNVFRGKSCFTRTRSEGSPVLPERSQRNVGIYFTLKNSGVHTLPTRMFDGGYITHRNVGA